MSPKDHISLQGASTITQGQSIRSSSWFMLSCDGAVLIGTALLSPNGCAVPATSNGPICTDLIGSRRITACNRPSTPHRIDRAARAHRAILIFWPFEPHHHCAERYPLFCIICLPISILLLLRRLLFLYVARCFVFVESLLFSEPGTRLEKPDFVFVSRPYTCTVSIFTMTTS